MGQERLYAGTPKSLKPSLESWILCPLRLQADLLRFEHPANDNLGKLRDDFLRHPRTTSADILYDSFHDGFQDFSEIATPQRMNSAQPVRTEAQVRPCRHWQPPVFPYQTDP
jgi:hypothetical protein